jgi:hypothetical protein
MNKRPKSREETPKEGSDSARRYRTAPICDRAAQNARVFETFPAQCWPGWPICHRPVKYAFIKYFQYLMFTFLHPAVLQISHDPQTSRFRD